ncbi:MAG: pyridoxal phosphate-dependent aminotransferase [Acidobacteriota bacterium]
MLEPLRASGTRELPRLSLIRQVLQAAVPAAIDLALGEPMHAPPEAALEVLRSAAAADLRYSPNAGIAELRTAVARVQPWDARAKDGGSSVLITAGSQQALAVICLGLLSPGEEVVVPEIGYPSYAELAQFAGGVVRRVAWDRLESGLSARTRLVILGSPANPTGEAFASERLAVLLERAALCGAWVVLDEIYAPLLDLPQWAESLVGSGGRVLRVGGVSKGYALTGLRVGWLVTAPEIVRRLLPVHQHLVTCAPSLSQRAALAALVEGESALSAARELYRVRRSRAARALLGIAGLSVRDPGVGFYLWVDARARLGRDTASFALAQARAGAVSVVPGEAFGSAGAGFLRVSVSGPLDAVDEGIRRLGAAIGDWAL